MARDRASIRVDMWADDDWRDLTEGAQHLYMLILSHPTLNYAGVAEWRPGRLAAMTNSKSSEKVTNDAAELEAHLFVVVDEDTEEVLVRSFVKHDGLLKQPKLAVSMTKAFAGIASKKIRQVLAFEVQKLREREPELAAWKVKQVQTILEARATDIRELTPAVTPAFTPGRGQAFDEPTTTATTTATRASSPAPSVRVTEADFERAWAHWPKKVERKKSLEKFKQVAKQRDLETLIADIARFGAAYQRSTEKQFIPALNVWLNGERWTDELPGAGGASPAEDIRNGFKFIGGKPVMGGRQGMNREQYDAWLEDQRANSR